MDKSLIFEASKSLRLKTINLYESNLKRFRDLVNSEELGQQTKLSIESETLNISDSEQQNQTFRVYVDLGVRIVSTTINNNEPEPIFQIEAKFQLDYELTGSVEQNALKEFANYNAVHNVWPFWRQYVFSTANQAGLPCPEVPLNISLQDLVNLDLSLHSGHSEI
ncbi:hypothetical protein [Methylobacter svalbardensis]|uniref:hypothetical protein n=1 Tax=Methylobacter svalbardensis TaxID=3080016 RepID=UPI0030EC8D05